MDKTVLVCGDVGVGKSTLCEVLAQGKPAAALRSSDSSATSVACSDFSLPFSSSCPNMLVMDSCSALADEGVLRLKIKAADAIIALFDVSRSETLDALCSRFLPLINECSSHPIVVLVGSKIDAYVGGDEAQEEKDDLPETTNDNEQLANKMAFLDNLFKSKVDSICNEFPFVLQQETLCLTSNQSSALVFNAFACAETGVAFPMRPLYNDIRTKVLSDACKRALLYAFRVFDEDRDGLLSDKELLKLQHMCLSHEIANQEMEMIATKELIDTKLPETGLRLNKLTFEGFQFLLSSSQPAVIWSIFFHLGFDRDLRLSLPLELSLPPKCLPYESTELSEGGLDFIEELARRALCEAEGGSRSTLLSLKHLDAVFRTLPPSAEQQQVPFANPPFFYIKGTSSARSSMPAADYIDSSDDDEDDDDNAHRKQKEQLDSIFTLSDIPFLLENWTKTWQMLAMFAPTYTQRLLYQLGYIANEDWGLRRVPPRCKETLTAPRTSLQVGVFGFGRAQEGVKLFVLGLASAAQSDEDEDEDEDEEKGGEGGSSGVGGDSTFLSKLLSLSSLDQRPDIASLNVYLIGARALRRPLVEQKTAPSSPAYLVVTAVSSSRDAVDAWISRYGASCDAFLFVFSNEEEFRSCVDASTRMDRGVPRLFAFYRTIKSNASSLLEEGKFQSKGGRGGGGGGVGGDGGGGDGEGRKGTTFSAAGEEEEHNWVIALASQRLKDEEGYTVPLHFLSDIKKIEKTLVELASRPDTGLPPRKNSTWPMLIFGGGVVSVFLVASYFTYKHNFSARRK